MKKIKNIHEVYSKNLFAGVQRQKEFFQRLEHYDQLAVDFNERMKMIEMVHKHLYFFYLQHLRQEKILFREIVNEKDKQLEIHYGESVK